MSFPAPIRQPQADPFERLLDVPEVARMLNMSEAWVRQHSNGMRRPSIPSIKFGKSVRFRREGVLQFIKSMERCA
jgi:predicted DNA-binding transcriptional regulator AlpA